MKLKALIICAFLTVISHSAFAQYFPANPSVSWLPGQVTAQVFNPYYEPIICNGQVFGQVATGQVLTTYFAEQFMPAGTSRMAYVTTLPMNPFVRAWANIHCRFARRW